MDSLTLTDIKSLTTSQATALCQKLNIDIPPEADLGYMRGYLRLLKIQHERGQQSSPKLDSVNTSVPKFSSFAELTVGNDYEEVNYYGNQNVIAHEKLLSESQYSSPSAVRLTSPKKEAVESPYYSSPAEDLFIQQQNMAERVPVFQPDVFSGAPSENVNEFFATYERVALANGWNGDRKKQLLPFYVSGVAKSALEIVEREKGQDLTWDIAKQALISSFSFVQNGQILEMELNNRMQTPGEPTVDYVTDVIRLCSLIDNTMQESRVCGHILKGINPATLQMISMLDNSTKEKLLNNISKFEQSSLLMRHRLGVTAPSTNVATPQPLLNTNHNGELNAKIDQLTQLVNQIQFDMKRDDRRAQTRESRYDQHSSNGRWRGYSGSRDPHRQYNGVRERSSSRGRDVYGYERRLSRSGDRQRYRSPGQTPFRRQTPTRVRFSDSPRQNYPTAPDFRNQYDYRPPAFPVAKQPSQPCRHCNKWGHWSQSCWSLKQKNY